ncbi:hypothetical protein [Vibrio sp. 11986-1-5]|uniref:hypothetical protein n=1 Tax=Vibrio sp. 11986-1-5 TaxID=2211215 RepID=UPI000D733FEE|nr:hypothetical protein [Vibrio sp. 11986-1-5]PXA72877.1 hypothetical protein DMC15_06950 [Vibrio sp. 11986-1-5]
MGGKKDKVKETPQEIAQAEIASKQWALYQNELKPFEDNFIQRVDGLNNKNNMDKAKASADLSYNQAFSQSRGEAASGMAAAGVDPSSGKFKQAMSDITQDQALGQADTVNRAQSSQQDKYIAGLSDVAAIGMGQQATAMAGLADVASLSQNKAANDAYNSFNRRSANQQFVGAVGGAGLRGYDEWRRSQPQVSSALTNDTLNRNTPR